MLIKIIIDRIIWVVVIEESCTIGTSRTLLSYETENIAGFRSGCDGRKQHDVTV